MRDRGLAPRFFCGGGWYTDDDVARVVADAGLVDCTATAFEPPVPRPYRVLSAPAQVEGTLVLPATHSPGMLARAVAGRLAAPVVHAYFHDTDLLVGRRRSGFVLALALLGLRRRQPDLTRLPEVLPLES
jgi:hypothetical protein